LNLVFKPP